MNYISDAQSAHRKVLIFATVSAAQVQGHVHREQRTGVQYSIMICWEISLMSVCEMVLFLFQQMGEGGGRGKL